MEFWNVVMLIILVYVCVYGIVSRICKSFETVAMAKAYIKYIEAGGTLPFEDLTPKVKAK